MPEPSDESKDLVAYNASAQAGDSEIRVALAAAIQPLARGQHEAMLLLEKVEKAIFSAALASSQNAELARRGFEQGAKTFVEVT